MIVSEKLKGSYEALKGTFGYTNKMAAPKITKVLVSVGTGKRARFDKSVHDLVADRLGRITGQKSSPRSAKKSIAGFKIRQGDQVGQVVTLRGKKMEEFLEKLIHISLPRTKDFRGLNRTAVDSMGNLTIGIREHSIFPECAEEELKDVFGLAINVVTTAKTRDEAMAFFDYLGVPFKKEAK